MVVPAGIAGTMSVTSVEARIFSARTLILNLSWGEKDAWRGERKMIWRRFCKAAPSGVYKVVSYLVAFYPYFIFARAVNSR